MENTTKLIQHFNLIIFIDARAQDQNTEKNVTVKVLCNLNKTTQL